MPLWLAVVLLLLSLLPHPTREAVIAMVKSNAVIFNFFI